MSDPNCDLLCIDLDHAEMLRADLPAPDWSATMSSRLRALGDPTRLRVAVSLERGEELCVCDLAWVVGSSQSLVSHHLRQLRAAGLVEFRKDGKLVMYRLTQVARALLLSLTTAPVPDETAPIASEETALAVASARTVAP